MAQQAAEGRGLWSLAWQRFLADRVGVVSALLVMLGLLIVALSASGLIASQWSLEVAIGHAPPHWLKSQAAGSGAEQRDKAGVMPSGASPAGPTATDVIDPIAHEMREIGATGAARSAEPPTGSDIQDPIANELSTAAKKLGQQRPVPLAERAQSTLLGADKWGRDVLDKTIKGAETSILVGLCAALISTLLGSILGAFSGWYGSWIDDLTNWIYNVFNAIPGILLILAIAAVLDSKGVLSVVMILGVTGWTGVYRLVRGEYLKHRERDYVRAAYAIGASPLRRMFVHVLPNVSHVILVQFSLLTVACIKAEVILSFLGFGVPVDGVSWGTMLTEAQNDLLLGIWWQLAAATLAMAVFVTALSLLTDALRDALDPKLTH
ncbi:MAG: ABC transporter permease [Betaproteobacteria bacterium]|nr:ABC transporter permease [Betaproteobacteria bacterium]